MAYDEVLVERVRSLLAAEPDLSERAMFGGLGFMLGGNMCCGAMKGGDLMIRVSADDERELLEDPRLRPMDFTGRPMKGWLLVAPDGFASDADLESLVRRAAGFVRTLPAKDPNAPKKPMKRR